VNGLFIFRCERSHRMAPTLVKARQCVIQQILKQNETKVREFFSLELRICFFL
jgi:hypothetical protein